MNKSRINLKLAIAYETLKPIVKKEHQNYTPE